MSERMIGPERPGGAPRSSSGGRSLRDLRIGRVNGPVPALLTVTMVAAMTAAALVPWWAVYESAAFLVAAGVAIVAGSAVAVAGAIRSWPSWAVVSGVVAAYLVFGVPVAVPGRTVAGVLPTLEGLVELVAGTALSWKQLVTIAVPVGSYQALLVPPFLLALVASATAVTIALRTTHPAAAALPPAVLLVAGIALGAVHDELAVQGGIAFLVACVAWLVRVGIASWGAVVAERSTDAALADVRRVVGAAALMAVALVGATAATVVAPPGPREVVRAQLQPPFEPDDFDSPLAAFRRAFDPSTASTPMLEVRGLPDGAGLRIATLDTYDGIVYSVGGADRAGASGQFTRLPYRLDQSRTPGEPVEIEVEVLGYDDVWVPGIGRLERIEFGPAESARAEALAEEFHYNDVTGAAGMRSGLREGDTYRAWSVASVDEVDLERLRPGAAVLPEGPDAPDDLLRLLDTWAPASDPPGLRLAKVIDGFHAEGYVSHGVGEDEDEPSRSGHSLDRLAEFATVKPMLGDGEQYAVAAALMARAIGFPARVVVGYLADGDGGDGVRRFRSKDMQAWIEVQTSGGEWVQVDPNPERREIPEREPDEPTVVSRPQSALPPPEERTPLEDLAVEPDSGSDEADDDAAAWLDALLAVARVIGIALAVVLLFASPFLAVVLAKVRRRRLRRRAPIRVERIEGGWKEFTDTAADYGYPIASGATRAEQAATVGGLGPLVLAAVVDRAVYAPGGPGDGDDDRVWEAVDDLHRRIAAPRSWRERLRAAISLASFGRYAGNRKGGGS